MKKILQASLKVFVSLILIVILLYIMRGKYDQILRAIAETDIRLFFAATALFICAIIVASYRLMFIVEAQEISITFTESTSLSFIGYFFNNFLPSSIGGDVVKAYYLSKKTQNKLGSYAAVFVDRVMGLITMVFMATIALFFVGTHVINNNVRLFIYAITILAIFGVILFTNKRFAKMFSVFLFFVRPLEGKIRSAYNTVHTYRHHKALMFRSVLFSALSQLLFFGTIGVLALSLGAKIPVIDLMLRIPLISTLSLLPSINGLGLREGSMVLLFGPIIGTETAFAVSILWLLVLLVISLLGGLVYGLSPQFRMNLKEIPAE